MRIRQATIADADAIAAVFSPSRRLLRFLPELHTVEEERWFIEHVILKECEVTVALSRDRIIAFLAREGSEVRLLHTHPALIGHGAGSLLLLHAKAHGLGMLELWCFQANDKARRFYERHGFSPVEFTSGERNEEKTPDVRYRWIRHRELTHSQS